MRTTKSKSSAGPAPNSTAPSTRGACHRSDGLTLPEARQSIWLEGGTALESNTVSFLQEPVIMGPYARLQPNGLLAAPHPDRVLARGNPAITTPIKACNFQPPKIASRARSPNALPRRHTSPGTGIRFAPVRPHVAPRLGQASKDSLPTEHYRIR